MGAMLMNVMFRSQKLRCIMPADADVYLITSVIKISVWGKFCKIKLRINEVAGFYTKEYRIFFLLRMQIKVFSNVLNKNQIKKLNHENSL